MQGSEKSNTMGVISLFQSAVALENTDVTMQHQTVHRPGIAVYSRHISQHKCTRGILVSLQERML